MSSKTIHTLAGLATGGVLALVSRTDAIHTALLLLGSLMGASAPDWMEIPSWVTKRNWFSPNERHRLSLIPHRTLTHTLSLWVLAALYSVYLLASNANDYQNILIFAFCTSVLTHLLLDIRTPMGIPLLPFGQRYRLQRLKLDFARKVQERH